MSTRPTASGQTVADAVAKMAAASKIASRIEISSIRTTEMLAKQIVIEGELPKHLDLTLKTDASLDRESNTITVNVRCGLVAKCQDAEGKSIDRASIDAVFRLDYRLKSREALAQDEINAFGELNGVYNAWPYWREYVQSTLSRMGLPVLTIPVFRPKTGSVPKSVSERRQQKRPARRKQKSGQ